MDFSICLEIAKKVQMGFSCIDNHLEMIVKIIYAAIAHPMCGHHHDTPPLQKKNNKPNFFFMVTFIHCTY